jgi:hypothetical protein
VDEEARGIQSSRKAIRPGNPTPAVDLPRLPTNVELVKQATNTELLAALLATLGKYDCFRFTPKPPKRPPWTKAFCDLYHPAGPWGSNKFRNATHIENDKEIRWRFNSTKVPAIYKQLEKYNGDLAVHLELKEKLGDLYFKKAVHKQSLKNEATKSRLEPATVPSGEESFSNEAAIIAASVQIDGNQLVQLEGVERSDAHFDEDRATLSEDAEPRPKTFHLPHSPKMEYVDKPDDDSAASSCIEEVDAEGNVISSPTTKRRRKWEDDEDDSQSSRPSSRRRHITEEEESVEAADTDAIKTWTSDASPPPTSSTRAVSSATEESQQSTEEQCGEARPDCTGSALMDFAVRAQRQANPVEHSTSTDHTLSETTANEQRKKKLEQQRFELDNLLSRRRRTLTRGTDDPLCKNIQKKIDDIDEELFDLILG